MYSCQAQKCTCWETRVSLPATRRREQAYWWLSLLSARKVRTLLYGENLPSGSLHVSEKLPTYPSPKPTFCLNWKLSVNVGLGEGRWAVSEKRIRKVTLLAFSKRLYEKKIAPLPFLCPSQQHSRMLWLSKCSDCLTLSELARLTKPKCLYGEKLARLGGRPYHHKRVTRLAESPF